MLNATLQGLPAVRLPSPLTARETAALSESLSMWRDYLIRRVTPNQYQRIVRSHVAIVNDPGSTE